MVRSECRPQKIESLANQFRVAPPSVAVIYVLFFKALPRDCTSWRISGMLLAPVVWVLTLIICYFFVAKTWWFPPPISAHALAYDAQFMRTLIVVGVIFFLAQFSLGYAIAKFRNDGRRASYSHGNNKLEALC